MSRIDNNWPCRNTERKCCAPVEFTTDIDDTAMKFKYALDDCKAQAGAVAAGTVLVLPVETLKDLSDILSGNPATGVLHLYDDIPRVHIDTNINAAARRRIPQSVFQKIFQHPLHQGNVTIYQRSLRVQVDVELYRLPWARS